MSQPDKKSPSLVVEPVADVERFYQHEEFRNGLLTTTLTAYGPVNARSFVGLMDTMLALLDSQAEKHNAPVAWMLVEAAVIGNKAMFTLGPVRRDDLVKMRKEEKLKADPGCVNCPECDGTGRDDDFPEGCPDCGGTGVLTRAEFVDQYQNSPFYEELQQRLQKGK